MDTAAADGGGNGAPGRSRRGGRRRRGRGGRGGEGAAIPAAGGSNLNGGSDSWADGPQTGGDDFPRTDAPPPPPRAEPRFEPHPEAGTDLRPDRDAEPRAPAPPPALTAPPPPPPPERPAVVWSSAATDAAGGGDRSQREE